MARKECLTQMKPTAARLAQKEMTLQKKHRMRMTTPGPPIAAYETCHTSSLQSSNHLPKSQSVPQHLPWRQDPAA